MSLAILDKLKDQLSKVKDDGEAMCLLARYLEGVTNRDATLPRMAHINTLSTMGHEKEEVVYINPFNAAFISVSSVGKTATSDVVDVFVQL